MKRKAVCARKGNAFHKLDLMNLVVVVGLGADREQFEYAGAEAEHRQTLVMIIGETGLARSTVKGKPHATARGMEKAHLPQRGRARIPVAPRLHQVAASAGKIFWQALHEGALE